MILDPFNGEDDVLDQIKASDWQEYISRDFANWLNRTLEGNNERFTGTEWHKGVWRDCFATDLRVLLDEVKQIIKTGAFV